MFFPFKKKAFLPLKFYMTPMMTVLPSTYGLILFKNSFTILLFLNIIIIIISLARKKIDWGNVHGIILFIIILSFNFLYFSLCTKMAVIIKSDN